MEKFNKAFARFVRRLDKNSAFRGSTFVLTPAKILKFD